MNLVNKIKRIHLKMEKVAVIELITQNNRVEICVSVQERFYYLPHRNIPIAGDIEPLIL